MTKKRLQAVMAQVYQKYGQEQTAIIADDLKRPRLCLRYCFRPQHGHG